MTSAAACTLAATTTYVLILVHTRTHCARLAHDSASLQQDRFLRFFDECPRYNSQVKDNATANPDLDAYKASKAMTANIALLKSKLRLPADADITVTDVESAFAACAYVLLSSRLLCGAMVLVVLGLLLSLHRRNTS